MASNCTPSSSQPLDPFFISGSSPSLLGSSSMVSFEDLCNEKKSKRPFFCTFDGDDNGDEDFDANLHQSEKKRRLSSEQVRFLEKSFEIDNKLEPERKVQLAKDLGLQPRQVAIWFQNRRARWKSKQLEKDFGILKANFGTLKTEYDALVKEKDKLEAEVTRLTNKLQLKPKDEIELEASKNEIQITASSSHERPTDSTSKNEAPPQILAMSSATSDVLDSDSPHYVDGPNLSAFAEPNNSSYELDHFNSHHFQEEGEDSLNPTFLSSSVYVFPKIEIFDDYPDDAQGNSWFW